MKGCVVSVIVVACIAVAAVLSLGVFLALRPRTKVTTTYLFADEPIADKPVFNEQNMKLRPPSTEDNSLDWVNDVETTTKTATTVKIVDVQAANVFGANVVSTDDSTSFVVTRKTTVKQPTAGSTVTETVVTQKETVSTTQMTLAPRERADLEVAHPQSRLITGNRQQSIKPEQQAIVFVNGENDEITSVLVNDGQGDEHISSSFVETNVQATQPPVDMDGERLDLVQTKSMSPRFGKVVGLAMHDNWLYVPSHQNGQIMVLEMPTMRQIRSYECRGCRIYDMAILGNGDIVIAQGKNKKVTIIDMITGDVKKEINTDYATKGVTVSAADQIFVLSRSHDQVYQYTSALQQINEIKFDNQNDCNFISEGNEVLYIGCGDAVHVVDMDGVTMAMLTPPNSPVQVTYSVGIHITNDRLYVIRRGYSQIDVYDATNGEYIRTLGPHSETLWSDMVVSNNRAYVIDYMTSNINVYEF